MSRHAVFSIPATISNGFDIAEVDGKTYLRVIAGKRAVHAVPQTSAELRKLAALMLNAADVIDEATS